MKSTLNSCKKLLSIDGIGPGNNGKNEKLTCKTCFCYYLPEKPHNKKK